MVPYTASGKMADQLALMGDDTASAVDALELQQAILHPVPTSAPVTHGVLARAHVGQISILSLPPREQQLETQVVMLQ